MYLNQFPSHNILIQVQTQDFFIWGLMVPFGCRINGHAPKILQFENLNLIQKLLHHKYNVLLAMA